MTAMEVILLLLGIGLLVASFVVPEQKEQPSREVKKIGREEIKKMVEEEMDSAKDRLKDTVDETVEYAIEKSERSLERLSNEKITAVAEFSDTVLNDIHKNHQDVMFLYDMLHDKQKNIRETALAVDKTSKEARQTKEEIEAAISEFGYDPNEETKEEEFEALSLVAIQEKTTKGKRKKKEKTTGKVIEPVTIEDLVNAEMPKADATIPNLAFDGNSSSEGNSNERILELHKQGKSNVAIAKELGLGVGEVNLVIDLFEVM